MARVAGSVAGRRTIPGLSTALAARQRYFDARFCMRPLGAPCGWCGRVERLRAGEPVTVDGEGIWVALFNPAAPRDWGEFMHDPRRYVVTGDRIALAD